MFPTTLLNMFMNWKPINPHWNLPKITNLCHYLLQLRDLELELDEEKRRHAESIKILRKKDRQVKEIMVQVEEDQKNIGLLNEALDKVGHKANIYKRQLQEQVCPPFIYVQHPFLH